MDLFNHCLNIVLKHEGGYVNDPKDPGGETIYGIARRHHPDAWAKGRPTKQQAADIYRRDYWDRMKCDQMPAPVALFLFDSGVNCGNRRAAEWLQRYVGAVSDGQIGAKTIAATWAVDAHSACYAMAKQRMAHYGGLNTFGRFGKGWARRVDEVMHECLALEGVA